tara:strand:- start:45 stop:968 length:924 start_codon:yes stop_codon:yes gene_type:complete
MDFVDKIYIISLERHKNRSKLLKTDLLTAGFDESKIEWIEAVDGNELNIIESIKNNTISDTFIDPYGCVSKGVYGCALSHQLAYEKFLETPSDIKNCLILEDDACVSHTLLRFLLPNSIGYGKFIKEMDTFDWDVILMGGQEKLMDTKKSKGCVLNRMKKYPKSYAAHSYIINKIGAKALIDCNKPIRLAADVNLHCSDVNLYGVPSSFFNQRQGAFEKWQSIELQSKFAGNILYNKQNWELDEIISSTTYGDHTDDDLSKGTHKKALISNKLEVSSMNWDLFTTPKGENKRGWANIHLNTDECNCK